MNIIYRDELKDYTAKYWFIINNLLLAVALILYGWNPYSIIAVYFLDTVIAGLFNAVKMAVIIYGNGEEGPGKVKSPVLIPFFIFHYGFFILIQVMLLMGFASSTDPNFPVTGFFPNPVKFFTMTLDNDGWPLLFSFLFGHSISFFRNFIGDEQYKKIPAGVQMFLPYPRIIIQQFVVIFGAFIMMVSKSPLGAPLILIALKTVTDMKLTQSKFLKLMEEKIKTGNDKIISE